MEERWSDFPEEDLYLFIRNSRALIQEGHPLALASYNEWRKTAMPPFTNLTDKDINNILYFVRKQKGQE